MNPDHAKATAQLLVQQLQFECATTAKVLAAVPDDKKIYTPAPGCRNAWELATHLATADVWFLDGILAGRFQDPDGKLPAETTGALADWYTREMTRRLEQVAAMDGAKLAAIIDFYGMKMPAVNYLLFTVTHMAHHRGQLSSYLRPMGAKVPSIYGGSADEPWKGAETATT